jgi:hypothetical protein
VHAFECLSEKGEPKLLAHQEIQWVRPDELPEYPMGKVDREISRTFIDKQSAEKENDDFPFSYEAKTG